GGNRGNFKQFVQRSSFRFSFSCSDLQRFGRGAAFVGSFGGDGGAPVTRLPKVSTPSDATSFPADQRLSTGSEIANSRIFGAFLRPEKGLASAQRREQVDRGPVRVGHLGVA